ncbi:Peroxisomal acyl-coenzyme A oxidase 3 [Halotydeus destructor]|nr:Peroxisomal acyl-coenzyme A oxidase 3 [Halotydeus destructor]
MKVYPGVTIGDMGPKMGLNGLDNGWIQFKNYRAPKSCLLNKYADVTPEGKYVAKASKKRRHGINLGTLSVGRIGIIGQACDSLQLATTIAIRYAAVRKQFGPTDEEEWPLLEYPTHQWRLFPYVAACYVIDHFQRSLYHNFLNFIGELHYGGGASDEMDALGAEIHSLSSAGKAVSGWMARDGVQEAREACGGHGYLKASRLGDLKNDLEPILTYEGDNNVLLPQASNFILKVYQEKLEGKSVDTSMATCEFLKYDSSLKDLQVDVSDIESLLQVFQRLASYLTRITDDALQSKLEANGGDNFRAKTQSNVYYMRSLAIVYYEVNAAKSFYEDVVKGAAASPEADVLRKMCHLYLLWSLEKQLVNLCHASDGQVTAQLIDQIRSKLLSLCAELKNEVVSLVDTYSPPDFVLNSVLGHSDGKIYEHLFEAMTQNEPTYATPPYQDEFGKTVATADVCASPQLKSKL